MSAKKPNLVFLFSDEHNAAMAGWRGHPQVETPHLDRLASKGTVFTRAYCNTPICGPSRLSMMTGRHLHELDVWCNNVPWGGGRKTWADTLGEGGYRTANIGKMDVTGRFSSVGFQEFDELIVRKAMDPWPLSEPRIWDLPETTSDGFEGWELGGSSREQNLVDQGRDPDKLQTCWGDDEYLTGYYDHDRIVTDRVKKFLQEAKGHKTPWILHVGLLLPHWPFICPKRYLDLYVPDEIEIPVDWNIPNENLHPAIRAYQRSQNDYRAIRDEDHLRRIIAAYYGMISCMDDLVGDILDELDRQEMNDETVVIYSSDHGEACGEHGVFTKMTPYENSVAVPMIIYDPSNPVPRVCEEPVSLVDIYPTVCDYAGCEIPAGLLGTSLRPCVAADKRVGQRSILAQYHGIFPINNWFMLLNGDYKYVWYHKQRPSLFNLKEDPNELHDLWADPKEQVRMREMENELFTLVNPKTVTERARHELGLDAIDNREGQSHLD